MTEAAIIAPSLADGIPLDALSWIVAAVVLAAIAVAAAFRVGAHIDAMMRHDAERE